MSAQLEREGERLRVSGPLTLATATALAAAAETHLAGSITLDLAGVTEVDSAGLSLLFEWRRRAAARQCTLAFRNLPASMQSLAELYGVADLIAPAA